MHPLSQLTNMRTLATHANVHILHAATIAWMKVGPLLSFPLPFPFPAFHSFEFQHAYSKLQTSNVGCFWLVAFISTVQPMYSNNDLLHNTIPCYSQTHTEFYHPTITPPSCLTTPILWAWWPRTVAPYSLQLSCWLSLCYTAYNMNA